VIVEDPSKEGNEIVEAPANESSPSVNCAPAQEEAKKTGFGAIFKKKKSEKGLNEAPWSAEHNAMPHGARF
jgi:hypothetical protein